MANYRLKRISENATITAINDLFRPKDSSQWKIDLSLQGHDPISLSIMCAPLLARKTVLNETTKTPAAGWDEHFSITSTAHWVETRIGDLPHAGYAKKRDAAQLCFSFPSNGKQIYLPQFELARALFFHNGYLARTALEPLSLNMDFDIRKNEQDNSAQINILPTSTLPLGLLAEPDSRNMLAWILLDQDARQSYESIGIHEKNHGRNEREHRRWTFQFDPPLLTNCRMHTKGHFISDSQAVFVYRIIKITNLPSNLPEQIDFFHNDLPSTTIAGGGGGAFNDSDLPDELDVDDERTTNADIQPRILEPDSVAITFSTPFQTSKKGNKARADSSETAIEGNQQTESYEVGLELGMPGFGLPSADWNAVTDNTYDTKAYERKFTVFLSMVTKLAAKCNCKENYTIRELPKIPRCKKHLLSSNGARRCMAVVTLQFNNKFFYLLEVDTSDGAAALSTLLLCPHTPDTLERDLIHIERSVLKHSLAWPIAYLSTLYGKNGFRGVKHPQAKTLRKGLLDPDTPDSWAERIFRSMPLLD